MKESVFVLKYVTIATRSTHSEAYRDPQIRFYPANPAHSVENVGTSYGKRAIQ